MGLIVCIVVFCYCTRSLYKMIVATTLADLSSNERNTTVQNNIQINFFESSSERISPMTTIYYLRCIYGDILIGTTVLMKNEDPDDAFDRFFTQSVIQTLLPNLSKVIFAGYGSVNSGSEADSFESAPKTSFHETRAELLLVLADLGFVLLAQDGTGKTYQLLYKENDWDTYYGREKTLKLCGLNFIPAA